MARSALAVRSDRGVGSDRLVLLLRDLWHRPLLAHLGALVALFLVLMPLAEIDISTPDEGAYGLQAEAILDGSWEYRSTTAVLDPGDRHFPIALSTRVGDRWFTYHKHPLVPQVMSSLAEVLGRRVGFMLLSWVGLVGSAVAAWLLGSRFGAGRARLSFWLVVASPVLFNAYVLWAHAPSTAAAGFAMVGAVDLARGRWSASSGCLLLAGTLAGVLLRSEGLIFAAALTAALVLAALARRRPATLAGATGVASVAVIGWVGEQRWILAIAGEPQGGALEPRASSLEPSWMASRVNGVWRSTFSGLAVAGPRCLPLAVALGVVLLLVVAGGRSRTVSALLPVAFVGLGAVALLQYRAGFAGGRVDGLLPAWPLVPIGLVAGGWIGLRRSALGLTTVAIFVAGVYATQYADGGGFQWGGRFLSPAIVPLAVAGAQGLSSLYRRAPDGRAFCGALVALAVLLASVSIGSLRDARSAYAATNDAVAERASPVNVTTRAHLPRQMWREHLPWLVAPPSELPGLLDDLHRRRIERVTVVVHESTASAVFDDWSEIARADVGTTPLDVVQLRR